MAGPKDEKGDSQDSKVDYYISADGRALSSASDAIDAGLNFESISGTGAGCNQDPENVSSLNTDNDDNNDEEDSGKEDSGAEDSGEEDTDSDDQSAKE